MSGYSIWTTRSTRHPAICSSRFACGSAVFIAERFGIDQEAARALQRKYFLEHGTTLRGLMTVDGVAPREFLDYVHDIDVTPVPPEPDTRRDPGCARRPQR